MDQKTNNKPYDLEERTFQFAKEVRIFVKTLEKSIANSEDAKQLIRASGSIGANYIEANEALSKKDFSFRVKICRKEAKESVYWLRLIMETNKLTNAKIAEKLIQEAIELKKILSAIIEKTK
ncbi:MAG: four helix bundle protein [Bacteroidales bacterium]|jgi:four helix bundle protein|nr:four helix bundle protein [Bacteroidales bacterium]